MVGVFKIPLQLLYIENIIRKTLPYETFLQSKISGKQFEVYALYISIYKKFLRN